MSDDKSDKPEITEIIPTETESTKGTVKEKTSEISASVEEKQPENPSQVKANIVTADDSKKS